MKFERLLEIVGNEPVFEPALLLAGEISPAAVRLQISRWSQAGKIIQLRSGLYALSPPYQKVKPHPFVIANRMVHGSYVSCQSALAFYGLIPEIVPATTSITTIRRGEWNTLWGWFYFQQVKMAFFYGYRLVDLGGEQQAFVAAPEKALLDLIYLQPGSTSLAYLQELRLQDTARIDAGRLQELAERAGSPRLRRSVEMLIHQILANPEGLETL